LSLTTFKSVAAKAAGAMWGLTASVTATNTAFTVMQGILSFGIMLAVTVVVQAVLYLAGAWQKARQEKEKFFEKSREDIDTLSKQALALKTIGLEYEGLKSKDRSNTATIEERKRLLEIEKELVEKYSLTALAIDKEGKAYNDSTVEIYRKIKALEEEKKAKIALMEVALEKDEPSRLEKVEDSKTKILELEKKNNSCKRNGFKIRRNKYESFKWR
jgi:hypothetical protein